MTGVAVLVHGAWHDATCWDAVVTELEARGVASLAVRLPLTGLADDVQAVREAITRAGQGCLVLGHSYGGVVISTAAADSAEVTRLIYLAAFLTEPDEDMFAFMAGGKLPESLAFGEDGSVSVVPERAVDVFYGDVDPETARAMVQRLRPMAGPGVGDIQPGEAWRSVPTTYVVCSHDQAIPVEGQRRMAVRAEEVVEWPTSHSPFLSRPQAVADLVARHLA